MTEIGNFVWAIYLPYT